MPDTVYVMIYNHAHGTDCSVFETEEDACATIRGIISENLHYYRRSGDKSVLAKLSKHLRKNFAGGPDIVDDDYPGAAVELWSLWNELTGEESFDIHKCNIVPKGGADE